MIHDLLIGAKLSILLGLTESGKID